MAQLKRINEPFGRYQLLMRLAGGGMATLYLGKIEGPEQFSKVVAIKKIHDHLSEDEEFIEMFLDEARLAARIDHPNVVTIFDMGQSEGTHFIAMEYVHGVTLAEILRVVTDPAQLPWPHAARLIANAASGLHAAHELRRPGSSDYLGVVHRDVSPQNLLVSFDGHVKIVDFGVAFAREKSSQTQAGMLKGKLAYMSPEQANYEDVDRGSDIFSLGIVLFETLTQRRLFKPAGASQKEILQAVRACKVPSLRTLAPHIPPALESIVNQALEKESHDRYSTAAEMKGALEKLLVQEGQIVGPEDIARTLDNLLGAERRERDRLLAEAMEETSVRKLPPLEMLTDGSAEPSHTLAGEEQTIVEKAKRNPLSYVVGGLGLALVITIGLLLFSGGSKGSNPDDDSPPTAKAPPSMPAPMPGPMKKGPQVRKIDRSMGRASVLIKITVRPEGTKPVVRFRGHPYRGSVFQIAVPRSDKAEKVSVEAVGYHTEPLMIVPAEKQDIKVKLRKIDAPISTMDIAPPPPAILRRRRRSIYRRPPRRRRPMRRPMFKPL